MLPLRLSQIIPLILKNLSINDPDDGMFKTIKQNLKIVGMLRLYFFQNCLSSEKVLIRLISFRSSAKKLPLFLFCLQSKKLVSDL
jgi:hypothetical protein